MTRVNVKLLDKNAKMPTKGTAGAAGLDLYAIEDFEIPKGGTYLAKTGLQLEIEPGYEGQIRARSGLAMRYSLIVTNAPGTIDSDYRGPVNILLTNLGQGPFQAKAGDRIAQLVIARVEDVTLVTTEELTKTERGAGGFGSTGK